MDNLLSGWWLRYTYNSEKYDFANWDDGIQDIGTNKNGPNHQPDSDGDNSIVNNGSIFVYLYGW